MPASFTGTGAAAELVQGSPQLAALADAHPMLANLLDAVAAGSPYLTGLIARDPAAAAALLASDPDQWLGEILLAADAELDKTGNEQEAGQIVRQAKASASLAIGLADIGAVWEVEEIIAALSLVAQRLVAGVVWFALRQAVAQGKLGPATDAGNSGFFVLAMGKLGAGELNYSSDIDLIVLFDPGRARVVGDQGAQKVFVGVTRTIVRLLHERTAHGYV
ncbi:MAG: bifunctional [glutamine synthetase] adenylyltransferase/[glutamine synthetase]-adenylyl-L-tyrosine phosphorylase, partial [Alphaproteobacteria bacterium]